MQKREIGEEQVSKLELERKLRISNKKAKNLAAKHKKQLIKLDEIITSKTQHGIDQKVMIEKLQDELQKFKRNR